MTSSRVAPVTPTRDLEGIVRASTPDLPPQVLESGSRQLYDLLIDRARSLKFDRNGFRLRDWASARADFEQSIGGAVPSDPSVVVEALQEHIITPASFQRLSRAMADYWRRCDLEHELAEGSLAIVMNHHFFLDMFLPAAVLRCLRQGFDPHAADRNVLIQSRLIATRAVDLLNDGSRVPMLAMAGLVARVLHTIQELPDQAPEQAHALRAAWNMCTQAVWATLAARPGNILHLAGGGAPDAEVETAHGRRLLIRPINQQTGRLLSNSAADHRPNEQRRRITVVGIFMSCPSSVYRFGLHHPESGPADARFTFLPPKRLRSGDDLHAVMHDVAAAGAPLVREEFPAGVRYVPTREAWAKLVAGSVPVA